MALLKSTRQGSWCEDSPRITITKFKQSKKELITMDINIIKYMNKVTLSNLLSDYLIMSKP